MSHYLLIRNNASIPPNVREVLSAPEHRIIVRSTPTEADTALQRGAFDAVILYADNGDHRLRRELRELKEINQDLFTIVFAPEYSLSSETTAFDEGADLYFAEPLPVQSLRKILGLATISKQYVERPTESPSPREVTQTASSPSTTLHTLRDLSHILSYSLDYKAFTQHFILKLRDHISFSRIGIFLENSAKQSLIKKNGSNHLECIAAVGLPTDLTDCFQLSREVGIGRELYEAPRILHSQGKGQPPLPSVDTKVEKEFAILGCHIAIPISDREGSIGVAVLNGPVTGRSYSNDELELLYVLMEELGLSIRNSRLHSELAQHGQLIENVLHSMSSGALVCGENLQVLYANDAARRFLQFGDEDRKRDIEFAELPAQLAGPIHRAVEKGELSEPFQISGPTSGSVYRVSIFPFTQKGELILLPRPTMIIVEDFTKIEASKQSAVADTKTKMIGLVAERFAHEIRNSLVPLSTHAQLIDKKINEPKFQASLKSALLQETSRIKRFSEQMLYMAQSSRSGSKEIELHGILEDAFDRARGNVGNTKAQLIIDNQAETPRIHANPEALKYALEEVFINSLQAGPDEQEIRVCLNENNEGILRIQISDGGPGFSEELVDHATEPFYTTRNTGVGLGLAVASKIVVEHDGFLRVLQKSAEQPYNIEIEFPLLLLTQ